jgi:hypothetical protein
MHYNNKQIIVLKEIIALYSEKTRDIQILSVGRLQF